MHRQPICADRGSWVPPGRHKTPLAVSGGRRHLCCCRQPPSSPELHLMDLMGWDALANPLRGTIALSVVFLQLVLEFSEKNAQGFFNRCCFIAHTHFNTPAPSIGEYYGVSKIIPNSFVFCTFIIYTDLWKSSIRPAPQTPAF